MCSVDLSIHCRRETCKCSIDKEGGKQHAECVDVHVFVSQGEMTLGVRYWSRVVGLLQPGASNEQPHLHLECCCGVIGVRSLTATPKH